MWKWMICLLIVGCTSNPVCINYTLNEQIPKPSVRFIGRVCEGACEIIRPKMSNGQLVSTESICAIRNDL